MIFGFNTDVKHGETVYHVQSEARERELRLQTQVFVRGQCVAKRATSYAEYHAQPGFSTEKMHDLLRVQHKEVIELVRSGNANQVASNSSVQHGGSAETDEPEPTQSAALKSTGLALDWLNPAAFSAASGGAVELQFLVSEAGTAVNGANVTVRLNGASGQAQYAQGTTAGNGHTELAFSFDAAAHTTLSPCSYRQLWKAAP